MNSQQAKENLLLYRPGCADPDDPDFAEALAQVQQDPELARWFEEHCRRQAALHAKFSQIAVPEGLKEQILSERKLLAPPPVVRPRRKWAAAAVSLVVLLVVGAVLWQWPQSEDNRFVNFRNRMASTVLRQYPQMDLETHDLARIHEYLAAHGQGGYALPAGLQKAAAAGCATLSWHEQPLAMVCFNTGRNGQPHEPDLFLFVIDRSAVRQAPPHTPEVVRLSRRFVTASWTSGSKTYVLGVRGDESLLRSYL